MKIKRTVIIVIALLFITFLINQSKEDLWDKNSKLLRERIVSLEEGVKTVRLTDITPFEWDEVYSFDPYTPKEDIYEIIGYKWDNISETVSEGMNQIVFLKDGKVVCYLYGYPSNNGFGISFSGKDYKNVATVLNIDGNLDFHVIRSDNIVYLKHIE